MNAWMMVIIVIRMQTAPTKLVNSAAIVSRDIQEMVHIALIWMNVISTLMSAMEMLLVITQREEIIVNVFQDFQEMVQIVGM